MTGNNPSKACRLNLGALGGFFMRIEVTPQIEGDESNWTNIYTNMIVNYNIDKEEHMNISELSMLPIDDEKGVKEVIDFMVK